MGIERLRQCIAGRSQSPGGYWTILRGCCPVAPKKDWQLAERAGDATPFALLPASTQSPGSPKSVITVGFQIPG